MQETTMSMPFSIDQVLQLAPRCLPAYRHAFAPAAAVLERYAISSGPLRLAHFVGQVLHETGGLTLLYEDLDYSAARLALVWPGRFRPRGPLDPAAYAHNPRKLANTVYAGRLGNVEPDDGYTFRGRGMLQLTGKDSYARATTYFSKAPAAPDLVRQPDAVLAPAWALAVAAAHWQARGCNEAADRDDVVHVTHLINGGAVGMPERRAWCARAKAIWH
jgi:putative chitinase